MSGVVVSAERPEHRDGVRALLAAAFPTAAEAALVDRLREEGDLAFASVAAQGGEVVGYAALSRMEAPFRALALAPVATAATHRRRGVAGAVVRDALEAARSAGWAGVFVLGDPAYYRRFGFDAALARGFASPYAGPHLTALALAPGGLPVPHGRIAHAAAFAGLG